MIVIKIFKPDKSIGSKLITSGENLVLTVSRQSILHHFLPLIQPYFFCLLELILSWQFWNQFIVDEPNSYLTCLLIINSRSNVLNSIFVIIHTWRKISRARRLHHIHCVLWLRILLACALSEHLVTACTSTH